MTKKILLGLVIVLALAFLTGLPAYACGNKDESDHQGKVSGSEGMKNSKVEVTKIDNIDNGVIVKITSDDPEVVTQIQKRASNSPWKGMKDAQVEVTKIATGVVTKITSDDTEVVKKIQEYNASYHGHEEGSKECQEAHKSGKCTGHEAGH